MRDIMGLMKQVQSAQAKLQEMQTELETRRGRRRRPAAAW